jgi:hypothetical protein
MIKPYVAACAALLAVVSLSAAAQTLPKRKPGLWEFQMKASGRDTPNIDDRLAQMTPEQRAQMEQMMKSRGMSIGPGNTQTMRHCVTSQEAEAEAGKPIAGRMQRDVSKCDEKLVSRTASEVRIHAVCQTPDGPSEFDMRVHDFSDVSFAMEMDGKSATKGPVHFEQKARWVSSDCGNVK